jgi:hypothetical protein
VSYSYSQYSPSRLFIFVNIHIIHIVHIHFGALSTVELRLFGPQPFHSSSFAKFCSGFSIAVLLTVLTSSLHPHHSRTGLTGNTDTISAPTNNTEPTYLAAPENAANGSIVVARTDGGSAVFEAPKNRAPVMTIHIDLLNSDFSFHLQLWTARPSKESRTATPTGSPSLIFGSDRLLPGYIQPGVLRLAA